MVPDERTSSGAADDADEHGAVQPARGGVPALDLVLSNRASRNDLDPLPLTKDLEARRRERGIVLGYQGERAETSPQIGGQGGNIADLIQEGGVALAKKIAGENRARKVDGDVECPGADQGIGQFAEGAAAMASSAVTQAGSHIIGEVELASDEVAALIESNSTIKRRRLH